MSTPKPSPPDPQPAPDPRARKLSEPVPTAPDQPQSVHRANMDPLPPVTADHLPIGIEGVGQLPSGVTHRDRPGQEPVPSEYMQPPVQDDRKLKPRPGPPDLEERDREDR